MINIFHKILRRYLEAMWCDLAYTQLKNSDLDAIDLEEFKRPGGGDN
jgi:hypothetical protein